MANPSLYPVSEASSTNVPSLLKVNGWSIPVLMNKADQSIEEIGERVRGSNGRLNLARRAQKQVLDVTTPWLPPEDIRALYATLQGRGDVWNWDDAEFYSSKGLYPDGTITGGRFRGSEIILSANTGGVLESYITHPKFGNACLALDGSARNRTPAGYDIGTSTTGTIDNSARYGTVTVSSSTVTATGTPWVASAYVGQVFIDRLGATFPITANTSSTLTVTGSPASGSNTTSQIVTAAVVNSGGSFTGNIDPVLPVPSGMPSQSAWKATWSGAQSFYFDPLGVRFTNGTDYCFSLYLLKSAGASSVTVSVGYEDGTTILSQSVTLSTTKWTRVQLKATPSTSGGHTNLRVTVAASASATLYATGAQCEASAVWHTFRPYAHSDSDATSITYILPDFDPSCDVTFSFWLRKWNTTATIFQLTQGANALTCSFGTFGGLSFGNGGGTASPGVALNAWSDWKHVACVYRQNPLGGSYAAEVWINGTLSAHATPDPVSFDSGAGAVVLTFLSGDCVIDDLVVAPWGMTKDQIGAIADSSDPYQAPPWLKVTGDFMGQTGGIICAGKAGKASSAVGQLDGQPFGLVQSLPFNLTQR